MIGYQTEGSGAVKVIILHDWMCDTSLWDGARAYLDGERFTWAFADLRGYGRSMGLEGTFTLEEAAADVIGVADALGWSRFAIVGHSMTTLIALHLAQHRPDRIDRAVVLTPPPPLGFGADDATLAGLQSMARGDDSKRMNGLRMMWGSRLSEAWIRFKLARWRATADPEAVAGYVAMFARHGLPDPTVRIAVPLLAVTGEQDAEIMRREPIMKLLAPLCERFTAVSLADCGHYPMQEAPPLLLAILERFLAGSAPHGRA
jgi:pimeloyl-ACP methyl ester carboxylesterase